MEKHGVVVVAQLPLLTPEDPASNPATSNFYLALIYC